MHQFRTGGWVCENTWMNWGIISLLTFECENEQDAQKKELNNARHQQTPPFRTVYLNYIFASYTPFDGVALAMCNVQCAHCKMAQEMETEWEKKDTWSIIPTCARFATEKKNVISRFCNFYEHHKTFFIMIIRREREREKSQRCRCGCVRHSTLTCTWVNVSVCVHEC